jgi:hypothetical protein
LTGAAAGFSTGGGVVAFTGAAGGATGLATGGVGAAVAVGVSAGFSSGGVVAVSGGVCSGGFCASVVPGAVPVLIFSEGLTVGFENGVIGGPNSNVLDCASF